MSNNDLFSNRPSIQSALPLPATPEQPTGFARIKQVLTNFLQSWGISLPFGQRQQLEEEISRSMVEESDESVQEIVRSKLQTVVQDQLIVIRLGKRKRHQAFEVGDCLSFSEESRIE
jgi:hypothetical protein